jgi:ribonuclease I
MTYRILLLFLIVLIAGRAEAASYDIYVLSLSWAPAFCELDRHDKEQCQDLDDRDYAAHHLTVHGLWPNYLGRNWGPQNCSTNACTDRRACQLESLPDELETDLRKYMPGVEDGLHAHEWNRHGTCSGLDYAGYFQATVNLARQFESGPFAEFLRERLGKRVEFSDLRKAFRIQFGRDDALQVTCARQRSDYYLQEIRTCWTRGGNNQPGKLTACTERRPRSFFGCGNGKSIVIDAVSSPFLFFR